MKPLSKADRAILTLLQGNGRATIEEIAVAAGLSASSAQRRVQNLRTQKIIIGDTVIVDPKALGFGLSMIVELEVEHDRPELAAAFHRWIATRGEVQNAWHVTGRGDYVLSIIVESIEAFDALMAQMMTDNRLVRKYTTSVALKTLKRSQAVPVST
jgi:Lrp/AsnC family transcriptional regulator, leucine-responsive regulatory protein